MVCHGFFHAGSHEPKITCALSSLMEPQDVRVREYCTEHAGTIVDPEVPSEQTYMSRKFPVWSGTPISK